jgi:hypothetical protein
MAAGANPSDGVAGAFPKIRSSFAGRYATIAAARRVDRDRHKDKPPVMIGVKAADAT